MIGAIIGDIVGSTYEFHNTFDYNFDLFPEGSDFTDDTVCTVAVADAILKGKPYRESLIEWCRRYPHPKGAYGTSFARWIHSENPQPYDSFGNGAAMRVSPIAWAFNNIDTITLEAQKSAECSHSHPEGIKGAQVIAYATYFLRCHCWTMAPMDITTLAQMNYGYDYQIDLPKIGQWNETCQGCVPLAIHLFSLSTDFEDAIRIAVSYGGDSDTLGAIVGSLAGAYYGIPSHICQKALSYLPNDMLEVVLQFSRAFTPEINFIPYLKSKHNG